MTQPGEVKEQFEGCSIAVLGKAPYARTTDAGTEETLGRKVLGRKTLGRKRR